MKNPKVLVYSPNLADSCSYWRCLPWLYAKGVDAELLRLPLGHSIEWIDLIKYDAVVLQRPYRQHDHYLIEMARQTGLKVILDFDDDLMSVHPSNPAYPHYNDPEMHKALKQMLGKADAVTVTTQFLAERYKPLTKRVKVIPNAWNDALHPTKLPTPDKFPGVITWRGTNSHNVDLDDHLDDIKVIAEAFPPWHWVFLGHHYWKVKEILGDKMICVPPLSILTYMRNLGRPENAGFGIIPLSNMDFNRAKSNIAWMEYTFANLACIAPDFDEWKKPGLVNYTHGTSKTPLADQFKKQMGIDPAGNINRSWEYIQDCLTLSKINPMRTDLAVEVLSQWP